MAETILWQEPHDPQAPLKRIVVPETYAGVVALLAGVGGPDRERLLDIYRAAAVGGVKAGLEAVQEEVGARLANGAVPRPLHGEPVLDLTGERPAWHEPPDAPLDAGRPSDPLRDPRFPNHYRVR